MIFKCFREYRDNDFRPVRSVAKITLRYLHTSFILDLLAIIPFTVWADGDAAPAYVEPIHILSLFKLLRLLKAKQYFTPALFNTTIKQLYDTWRQNRIDSFNETAVYDRLTDYNKIA